MFILYALPIGILAGYLMGGRLDRLGELRFRWGWLAMAGLLVQVVLFSGAMDAVAGDGLGATIYVAGVAKSLEEGIEAARKAVASGKAREKLDAYIAFAARHKPGN